jgi:predicted SAM-dependent methyltransferase
MDIESYLQTQTLPRLHIGCGDNLLQGWLNSDFPARSPAVLELDATRTFPFRDGAFSYVYSEHMIEHVPYAGGASMLKECHRVLKPGGKIRISTPDLRFLIDLYLAGDRRTALQNNYIKWATDTFQRGAPGYDPVFVINNFVRDWGHVFIYDEKILRYTLEQAGFRQIERVELNTSADEALRNLEFEPRLPPGFLRLETMTLEATRSAA